MMRGRHTRGASALMAVMLLGLLAGAALLLWHERDADDRRRAAARDDGRLLAVWLKVAHDATMISDYRTALAADLDGFALAPASLPGAPPGLPVPVGLTLGVMDDGFGVPMAWAALAVDGFARASARLGALDAGMAAVGVGGEAGGLMSDREAAVGAARGTAVPAGSLFATAFPGLPFQEEALYRRAQPGRPWASRMEAALDLDGNDVRAGGAFRGRLAWTTGDVDVEGVCVPVPPATECSEVDVAGRLGAASLSVGGLDAETVEGPALAVTEEAEAGRIEVEKGVAAATVTASGRIDAGSLRTIGRVTAQLLVIGGSLSGGAGLTVRNGGIDGRELAVLNGLTSTGPATARTVLGGGLTAGSVDGGSVAVAGDAFGPSATVTGTLTVGSCRGCVPGDDLP